MTIKQARQQAGLTQKELAEKLKISQVNVSRWENGKRIPNVKTLCKIAIACNANIDALIWQYYLTVGPHIYGKRKDK